jgi:hypothetical protein
MSEPNLKAMSQEELLKYLEQDFMPKVLNKLAENARLKAEVERLKEGNECLDQMHEKEMARSAFLCEEVNRTTAWGRGLESDLSWARAELLMVKAEVERLTDATTRTIIPNEVLQAEVERLKRSGDLMLKFACANMPYPPYVTMAKDWLAAKEGKQP